MRQAYDYWQDQPGNYQGYGVARPPKGGRVGHWTGTEDPFPTSVPSMTSTEGPSWIESNLKTPDANVHEAKA